MNNKIMFVLLNLTEAIYAVIVVMLAVYFNKWWVLFGLLVVGFEKEVANKIIETSEKRK